jgi:tRNA threonylcarbamoyladenosine modification (KEOPS) complex  Pcc1 subunit
MPAVRCIIDIEYPSEKVAKDVHRSVELDNEGYVKTEVNGNLMHVEALADSLNSLIHTLDDFLSCVRVAEGVVRGKP